MKQKRFDPNTVSDTTLLDELKSLAQKLGKVPSRSDMTKGTAMTKRLYLYGRRFGGLTQACEKAGLVAHKGGKYAKYTDEELLEHIKYLKSKLGRTPTQADLNADGKYAAGAYKRHFGTYNNALKKLGIRHNMKHNVSEQDIINDVISAAKHLGRSPTSREFDSLSETVCWQRATTKTGNKLNWNALLKKCGLKVLNNRNIPDQDLKDEIERLRTQINRIPGYYDMLQLGCYSPETYAMKFGSYVKALEHFGYDYTPTSQWHNQTHTRGKDGTLYKSKFEANIADALYGLKANGKIQSYEYEKPVCADRKWTCDFYLVKDKEEIWLEADGLGDNREDPYDINNDKIDYYNNNSYKYIIIPYKKIDLMKYIENII